MSWAASADLVVVGSGVAGLSAALEAHALGLRVLVVTKAGADAGSTAEAQGGVAVVLGDEPGDSVAAHAADTVRAGAGLSDPDAVSSILASGAMAVAGLRACGASFDTDPAGVPARTREGGHSAFRVLHAGGDATGAEVQRALLAATSGAPIALLTGHTAVDLALDRSGAVAGLALLDPTGEPGTLAAPAVLLATGGCGQLYASTTNPATATGDGLALALRAGAVLADLEFVQFHPTALHTGLPGRRPLVTEAVRGEGGILVDHRGGRVLAGVHPLADLAPRDVVSAALTRRMAESGTEHVYLDARMIDDFALRFPTVHGFCRGLGVDPAREPIPVSPVAHYACGGALTDLSGRTTVPGLYAAGEVARTGLHGANRLASNSLLEGLVMGARAARSAARDGARPRPMPEPEPTGPIRLPAAERGVLQRAMSAGAGIGRSAAGLAAASDAVEAATGPAPMTGRAELEDAALTLLAQAVLAAAGTRTESRGCHVRTDFPATDDLHQRASLHVRLRAERLHVAPAERVLGGVA